MEKNIAVIGAGVSGLSAACLLTGAGFRVSLFEKSRGVSGRAASRTGRGCRYDHGANYFTVDDEEVRRWIFEELDQDGLVQIEAGILPFDASGNVGEADQSRSGAARYSYRDGISSLGKKMRDRFGLDISHNERIVSFEQRGGSTGWMLRSEGGGRHGEFGAVLVTAPPPQVLPIVEASEFGNELRVGLSNAFRGVRYFCQYSVVLNFAGQRRLPRNAYALINSDRTHAIAWISDEGIKAGHMPADESLFVVQMAPQWSSAREEIDKSEVADQACLEVVALLGDELPAPNWSDVQWWRFAHPQPGAIIDLPDAAADSGLYFAGDAFAGKGRVAGALKSGFAAARDIIRRSDNK